MKIKKIIDICKKNGNIIIFEGGKEQWISDGAAVFPMFNLPQFDEDSLCKTYDITDKQRRIKRNEFYSLFHHRRVDRRNGGKFASKALVFLRVALYEFVLVYIQRRKQKLRASAFVRL